MHIGASEVDLSRGAEFHEFDVPELSGADVMEEVSQQRSQRPPHRSKGEKRADRQKRREENQKGHLRECRALLEILRALPTAVPTLATSTLEEIRDIGTDEMPQGGQQTKKTPLEAAAEAETLLEAVEEVLRIEQPYNSLPEAFGPVAGVSVLGAMLDRPAKYQEKYLAQELSLVYKIWALATAEMEPNVEPIKAEGRSEACRNKRPASRVAVVDIGAGNGCLALLAAILLDGFAVLIDHTLPPGELRVELKVPEPYRSRVLRLNGDIGDLDAARDLEPLLAEHGVQSAVVVAKHLCGLGTDLAASFVERWLQGDKEQVVHLLGVVFATCCGHKLGVADRATFGKLHEGDPYLKGLTGGDTVRLGRLLELCTRCISWRTTERDTASRIISAQVRAAEMFEDVLQQPRLRLLGQLFPVAAEVVFVPSAQSPQNRCLLAAGSASALAAATGRDTDGCVEMSFMEALMAARDELLSGLGGPLDLKPYGFVSPKYDYDGT